MFVLSYVVSERSFIGGNGLVDCMCLFVCVWLGTSDLKTSLTVHQILHIYAVHLILISASTEPVCVEGVPVCVCVFVLLSSCLALNSVMSGLRHCPPRPHVTG